MTENKNFTGQATPNIADTEYTLCNFRQWTPHTRIFPGDDTPRTFFKCNLYNCDLPPGSTVTLCNWRHDVRDAVNDEDVTINGVVTTLEAWTSEPGSF